MEALAFIRSKNELLLISTWRPAEHADGPLICGRLHSSEDGEALRRSALTTPRSERETSEIVVEPRTVPRWFAVYTTCRHEKRIAQHLTQRGIEFYLPLYRSERRWRDGSKVALELPLFPSYIFVHIQRSDRASVLSVPGALAMVGGTGGEPAPLTDDEIDSLRAGLQERKVEPHALVGVGQQVRIRSGAFAGMEGVVVRKKNGFRVVLTLEQIMQSIAVEVSEEDVYPVGVADPFGNGSRDNFEMCLQGA